MPPDLRAAPSRARAALVAAPFVAAVALGPIVWFAGVRAKTPTTTPWPQFAAEAFLDGRWTEALDVHLRESSPITVQLRGVHRDLSFLLGSDQDHGFLAGRGGVWFVSGALHHPRDAKPVAAARAARTGFFAALAAWSADRGVRVLAAPVPDKRRVRGDRLPPTAAVSPALAARYQHLVTELRDAGIGTLDLETPMLRWQAERPFEPLYADRDSHWTFENMVRVGDRIAAELDGRGWLAGIPAVPMRAGPVQRAHVVTDLGMASGFRPGGALRDAIRETLAAGAVEVERPSASPRIALAGDSFAHRMTPALTAGLGRPIDDGGAVPAKGPAAGLVATLQRIDAGELDAAVVVWIFVERAMVFADDWAPAPPAVD